MASLRERAVRLDAQITVSERTPISEFAIFQPADEIGEERARISHENAIKNPIEVLNSARKYSGELDRHYSINFSKSRAYMPILSANGNNQEDSSVIVLANSGGQLMNSDHYTRRHSDRESRDLLLGNEIAMGLSMLAYTTTKDTLIVASDNSEVTFYLASQIADSFESIGIELTRNVTPVDSVDRWMAQSLDPNKAYLPNVLTPELIDLFVRNNRVDHYESEAIKKARFANVAAYTKDGTQKLWESTGVPTPSTYYLESSSHNISSHIDEILEKFSTYDQVVINTMDGSGGYGIVFCPLDEVEETLSSNMFNGQYLQIQGRLNISDSPCLIANIDAGGSVEPLMVSRQIFSKPGAHSGNMWHKGLLDELERLSPGFQEVNMQAIKSLAEHGVRGQINVDSLCLSENNPEDYAAGKTLMREANIRPAGSSVINRIRQGNINGQPIDRILTTTEIPVDLDISDSTNMHEFLYRFSDLDNTRVVLYNYNTNTKKASVAFCATSSVSEKELLKLREQLQAIYN